MNISDQMQSLVDVGHRLAIAFFEKADPLDMLDMIPNGGGLAEQIISDIEAGDPPKPGVDCGPGCPYCCSMQIRITAIEGLLLGQYVKSYCTDERIDQLRKRIVRNIALTDGKQLEEKVAVWEQTPCIFIEEGSCSVHPIRPFICRAWHSTDATQCKKAFASKDPLAEIDSLEYRKLIYMNLQEGMRKAMGERGLQDELMVVTKAVLDVLDYAGDPVSDWLGGKAVFTHTNEFDTYKAN